MAHEQVTRLGGKKFYSIVESNPQEALNDADELCEKEDFDYIFFDLHGTLNNKDLIIALANMDYIIALIAADHVVMESTLNYMISVRDNIVGTGKSNIKAMHLLWNMVDDREKSDLYEVYKEVIKELGFSTLKTFIPNSLHFRRSEAHRQFEKRKPYRAGRY